MLNLPVNLVATVGAVFLAVALLTGFATYRVLLWNAPARRRVRELAQPQGRTVLSDVVTVSQTPSALKRLSRIVPKSARDMSRLQRTLAAAGYRRPGAAVVFSMAEVIIPAVFAVISMLLLGFRTRTAWGVTAFVAVVGYFVPGVILDRKIALRRKQIRNGLPDVLDLLIVCLEAGSSLDQAIVKAGDELEITYPMLADELRTLNMETRAGRPRIEAFRNLAQRTKVDDVRAMVAMLVQTDRFGTSVAQALRTFADSLRTRRRQEAEERAAKVGVKLVFPLVLCLFPAFFVVALGPAILRFIHVFFGAGTP
ncbi:MAG: Flp pilus assembly protein TadB [Deltaproteobacteria bacterium]|nr:Flp pilus assembly protein TadB [Deltaproteobacteria bacterium]